MKTRGGKRPNAGRKSKAEEQSLIEKLSPMENFTISKRKRVQLADLHIKITT